MRLHRILPVAAILLAAMCCSAAAQAATTPTITEFAAGTGPLGIAQGPDGNVWFADNPKPTGVGKVTPGGAVSTYAAPTGDARATGITAGPGGLWFTENAKNRIGRATTAGVVSEFPGGAHDKPVGITAGPDGNLWYTATGGGGAIARITPTGTVTEFTTGLTANSSPRDIALGPDGNLWFTEAATNQIGRITPQGRITEFGGLSASPMEITAGPDGNLWFTEQAVLLPAIGRITPSGVISEFRSGLSLLSAPQGITAANDGNLYFTDNGTNTVGQVTTSGVITRWSAGITGAADLQGITSGGDGRIWFAELAAGQVGRMTVAPGAGAVAASAVTDTAATVSGAVSPNSDATTYHFEWGLTAAYGQSTPEVSAGSGSAAQTVSEILTGLTPSTAYHVRLVATNGTGTTYGPDRTFTTTAPGAPSATSQPATGVGATGATLNATVNPSNGATTYHFEWGLDTNYGNSLPATDAPVGSDAVDHPLSDQLTGLDPNATYHFRVVATSPSGTTFGEDEVFTTGAIAPDASTSAAASVSGAAATLTGTVSPKNSTTAYRFEWGETTNYGSSAPTLDAVVAGDLAVHTVTEPLTGLAPNTTYHFRLVATSNAGVTAGASQTFRTAAVAPLATTVDAAAITPTAVTLRGAVNPQRSATTYRFEWGTTTAYGQTTAPADVAAADLTLHDVTADITGLVPATTYHFRVVAESAAGTTYGEDMAVTTAAAPGAPPAPHGPGAAPAGPRAKPELGKTAVATVTKGVIRFRDPRTGALVQLRGDATIPSGASIDTRAGTVVLETALDGSGATQRATFHGAIFKMSLSRRDPGMVDVRLTQAPPRCPRTGAAVRAAAAKAPDKLWIKDRRGKYRTHGRNSVATVRGTEWTTAETCAGTLTRVITGAVSVRDVRTGKSVLLRAGHVHLARRR